MKTILFLLSISLFSRLFSQDSATYFSWIENLGENDQFRIIYSYDPLQPWADIEDIIVKCTNNEYLIQYRKEYFMIKPNGDTLMNNSFESYKMDNMKANQAQYELLKKYEYDIRTGGYFGVTLDRRYECILIFYLNAKEIYKKRFDEHNIFPYGLVEDIVKLNR